MTYLNVVLHGLYLLVQRKGSCEILIPDMGAEHTYRAGEFLGERVLAPGTYFLTGVKNGDGPCNSGEFMFVQGCNPVTEPTPLYARIITPTPKCVENLGQVHLTSGELQVDPSVRLSSMTVSALQVLKFEIADGDPRNVRLGTHWFTKSVQQFGDDVYMSLHIFSAPDRPEIPSHTDKGFSALVAMGEGLAGKMSITSTRPVPDPGADPSKIPAGLIADELRSLSKREDRLTYIGRWLREVQASQESGHKIPASALLGVTGDILTCMPFGAEPGD